MMNTPSDFQTPAAPGMVNADQRPVDVVVLFSGGLDSILAAKVLEEQGLRVCCLHCHSPFFGDPGAVERWSNLYGLDIRTLDVSDDFCAMLRARPAHGFGKVMNPCVDCKILLLRHARLYMESIGARLLATGEVMGQRPMSQRRDVLNAIRRDAGVQDILLRPLSALHLAPTPAEEEGFVDRSRLLGISGRGRKDQLELAKKYQLPEIPTPGGGCRLADKENARRYWPVLSRWPEPDTRAFKLSNLGRQFWAQQDGRDYRPHQCRQPGPAHGTGQGRCQDPPGRHPRSAGRGLRGPYMAGRGAACGGGPDGLLLRQGRAPGGPRGRAGQLAGRRLAGRGAALA